MRGGAAVMMMMTMTTTMKVAGATMKTQAMKTLAMKTPAMKTPAMTAMAMTAMAMVMAMVMTSQNQHRTRRPAAATCSAVPTLSPTAKRPGRMRGSARRKRGSARRGRARLLPLKPEERRHRHGAGGGRRLRG